MSKLFIYSPRDRIKLKFINYAWMLLNEEILFLK